MPQNLRGKITVRFGTPSHVYALISDAKISDVRPDSKNDRTKEGFLIRDEFGEAVDTTNSGIMQQLQTAFTIEENEELLDLDETNFFVDNAANTRSNMVVLLDYTGSMFNADPGNGAAITQMVSSTRAFLQDLPTSFSVALMEYHDRQQSSRLIRNFDDDREVLDDALESFAVPVAAGPGCPLR